MTQISPPPWLQWPEITRLIQAFADAKADMRFVGGSVRDALLEKPVQDVDAATPLTPQATMMLLEKADIKVYPTGIDHGTVTAVIDKKHFEITTLRKDVSTDGRHAEVAYTDDWKEDAARRDFTLNALYLSPRGELFDYFGGAEDAKAGRVRFIGDPEQRIREDYLRILRFFRFYTWYGKGRADAAALAACTASAKHTEKLSGERIQQEMTKLLAAPMCHLTIDLMRESALFRHLFGFDLRDTGILARLDTLQATHSMPPYLKWMGFILACDIPADVALDNICERLRLSNAVARALRQTFLHYDQINPDMSAAAQKKLLRRLEPELFRYAILIQWARGNDFISPGHPYATLLKLANEWQPPLFPVTGDDLIALGIAPGKPMGELLHRLEEQWEDSDYKLTKEQLLHRAQEKR